MICVSTRFVVWVAMGTMAQEVGALTVQLLGALTSQECPPPSLGLSMNDISSDRSGAARHLSEEPFTLT